MSGSYVCIIIVAVELSYYLLCGRIIKKLVA
ncbi:Protein of unknown function [Bacillus cytotoxicus]|uniref:Uncharacterized protein n=1 Tax=Bacillus cytotoxicus TaxID=580165 RepID=A0AAX2CMI1_9BACI|nr:Protein of unknown function [Bacillus cytotoxicus]